MVVHRAYKYRLDVEESQLGWFSRSFGCARFVYNHFLAARSAAWKERSESSSFAKDCKALTQLKSQEGFEWLYEVSNIILQQALKHLNQAYSNFFAKRGKYPTFKRKGGHEAVSLMRHGFKLEDGQLWLAKLDTPVRVLWSRKLPSEPSQVTLSRDSAGRYFVSFLCEADVSAHEPVESVTAIDLGLSSYIVDQDGQRIEPPKFLASLLRRLAHLQRGLSRKQKGSANRAKAKHQVARLHARIADARGDFLHKLSAKLIRENQAVFAEKLNIKGLVKTRLARSIFDASWGELLRQLAYKAKWYGRTFWQAPQNFASSKTCHACGVKNTELTLAQRRWRCVCGVEHDRDTNAARNLLLAGLAATKSSTAGLAGI